MSSKAFQRTYTRLEAITKATVTLRAQGVSNDELATVAGRLAQVVKIKGDLITLQVFAGTEGIPTNAEVLFHGEPPTLEVSEELSGRFFNAYGDPIDALCPMERQEYMLTLVLKICDIPFAFDDYEQCAAKYKEIINVLRQMNYSEFKSEKFNQYLEQLNTLLSHEQ